MISLFEPLTLNGVTLRNRIGMSPMCMYACEPDAVPTPWHMVHLGSRAAGGAALVIAEASAVAPEGRISGNDAGIWSAEQAEAWVPIVDFGRSMGAVMGIQLAHAGRKAGTMRPYDKDIAHKGGWPNVGPTDIPFRDGMTTPSALTLDDIQRVKAEFASAARLAEEAQFNFIEIHGAHGYLLHQFYSPLSNTRTDEYGVDFNGRTRLIREIAAELRPIVSGILAVRISASDWVEGGWTVEDSVALSLVLKGLGVDLVDCSSGGATPDAQIPYGPGYQLPFAEKIRREAGIATAAVGAITEFDQAEAIVASGQADVVLLGREYLRRPYWALDAARALGATVPLPGPYSYLG
jgi:2,4-dienoyl-CoA reductase-like NADH-dependent reductase (Old Yellow Enzyme family)